MPEGNIESRDFFGHPQMHNNQLLDAVTELKRQLEEVTDDKQAFKNRICRDIEQCRKASKQQLEIMLASDETNYWRTMLNPFEYNNARIPQLCPVPTVTDYQFVDDDVQLAASSSALIIINFRAAAVKPIMVTKFATTKPLITTP
jgi:hypothetical protein